MQSVGIGAEENIRILFCKGLSHFIGQIDFGTGPAVLFDKFSTSGTLTLVAVVIGLESVKEWILPFFFAFSVGGNQLQNSE